MSTHAASPQNKHKPKESQRRALKAFEEARARQAEEHRQHDRNYMVSREAARIIEDLGHKNPTQALARTIFTGVKLAQSSGNIFYNELAAPIALVAELKKLGPSALVWAPETLCAVIDERYGGWTKDRVTKALEHFHATGELDTGVPDLVRQKLYSLRIIITSDSAHNFWENFEKVGCAFNDRLANFSVVQALSAAECARTLAIIQNIRPDQYSKEVRVYIAACCHQDGLYTSAPSKWLGAIDRELQEFNESATGASADPSIVKAISDLHTKYKKAPPSALEDSTESIQAAKLLGIDAYANEALTG